jgi:hypothetical protein
VILDRVDVIFFPCIEPPNDCTKCRAQEFDVSSGISMVIVDEPADILMQVEGF